MVQISKVKHNDRLRERGGRFSAQSFSLSACYNRSFDSRDPILFCS